MATRLYLPSSGTAAGSPSFSATWVGGTDDADRRRGVRAKIATAMANKTCSWGAVSDAELVRQYVFDPMAAQTISGTVKGQVRCKEDEAAADLDTVVYSLRVFDKTLTTLRGTLKEFDGPVLEWATSLENRKIAAGEAVSNVACLDGDRLVLEIGGVGSVSGAIDKSGALSFGDDHGTDLGENTTDTDPFNPWFELSHNIAWLVTEGAGTAQGNSSMAAAGVKLRLGAGTAQGASGMSAAATVTSTYFTGGAAAIAISEDLGRAQANLGASTPTYVRVGPGDPNYDPYGRPATGYDPGGPAPYFAFVQDELRGMDAWTGWGGGTYGGFNLVIAILALPVQHADPDELHVLATLHEVGGPEILSLGITPSGKVGIRTSYAGLRLSAPVVAPGPTALRIGCYWDIAGNARAAYLNDVELFSELIPPGVVVLDVFGGLVRAADKLFRYMFLNGPDGLTRVEAILYWAEAFHGAGYSYWSFGGSSNVPGHPFWFRVGEGEGDDGGVIIAKPDTDLTSRWYDPTAAGLPLKWGPLPTINPTPITRRTTSFRGLRPGDPAYDDPASAATAYRRAGPTVPAYNPLVGSTTYRRRT